MRINDDMIKQIIATTNNAHPAFIGATHEVSVWGPLTTSGLTKPTPPTLDSRDDSLWVVDYLPVADIKGMSLRANAVLDVRVYDPKASDVEFGHVMIEVGVDRILRCLSSERKQAQMHCSA